MLDHELEIAKELRNINPLENWIVYSGKNISGNYTYTLLLEGMKGYLLITDDVEELKNYVELYGSN
jgi:hypothetical protein